MVLETDVYPPNDNFCQDVTSTIPASLLAFLDYVMVKKRKIDENLKAKIKTISIAHAIIHPRIHPYYKHSHHKIKVPCQCSSCGGRYRPACLACRVNSTRQNHILLQDREIEGYSKNLFFSTIVQHS